MSIRYAIRAAYGGGVPETFLTLDLEHVDPDLSRAHRELYPERIAENIPLSITLLYPWIPADELTDDDVDAVRAFFATCPSLRFDLVHVAEFPGAVAYAVPEPDGELRATMRALWARYPQYPPYGKEGNDPPPHCTLARYAAVGAVTLEQVRARVEPLLPVTCELVKATLMVETEPDRVTATASLPFRP
jgi:hypothetical protein